MPYQQNSSTAGFTRDQEKMQLPNATWAQEPLIVNTARVSNDNLVSREREQFVPAVFVSNILYNAAKFITDFNSLTLLQANL